VVCLKFKKKIHSKKTFKKYRFGVFLLEIIKSEKKTEKSRKLKKKTEKTEPWKKTIKPVKILKKPTGAVSIL